VAEPLTPPAAGGQEAVLARARPLLETIGGKVLHAGAAPGAGHALKALNNLLAASLPPDADQTAIVQWLERFTG